MSEQWHGQAERGSTLALRFLVWVALRLGRQAIRVLLYPIVGYYLLTAGAPRRAARAYWKAVGVPKPGWRRLFRHFYSFAAVAVDRFYFSTGRTQQFEIDRHNEQLMIDQFSSQQGCVLLMSHVGSFDVIRALAAPSGDRRIRLLMDRAHNARAIDMLSMLDPEMAEAIIDAAAGPAEMALQIQEAVKAGQMVGIMADRLRDQEPGVTVDFLGKLVRLPLSPWMLAIVLKIPVIMCTGLYRGGNRYSVYFDAISIPQNIRRNKRHEAVADLAQQYAGKLQAYVGKAPYNWFNFYPYWHDETDNNK